MKRDKIEMTGEFFLNLLRKISNPHSLPLTDTSVLQSIALDYSRNIVTVYIADSDGTTPEGQESLTTWADGISE